MNRGEILLAGLAAGGENATYTPVQVQKLFFSWTGKRQRH